MTLRTPSTIGVLKLRPRVSTAIIAASVIAGLALPAEAADRVRAGQWAATTTVGGKTYHASSCISPSDAIAKPIERTLGGIVSESAA